MHLLGRVWKPWFVYRPQQFLQRAVGAPPATAGYQPLRTSWGVSLLADPTKAIGRSVFTTGVYDLAVTEALARLIDPGDTVVDAGANVGYMAVLASIAAGASGRVLAFEPHPGLCGVARRNADAVRRHVPCAEITVHEAALGDRDGTAALLLPSLFDANDGVGRLALDPPPGARTLPVAVGRLDDVLGDERVGVLKLDVEGAELLALRGATAALESRRIRHIVFEDHDAPDSDVVRLLQEFGYVVSSLGWSMRGLCLGPVENGRLSTAYEAASYIASTIPHEVAARCARKGWLTLSERFAKDRGRDPGPRAVPRPPKPSRSGVDGAPRIVAFATQGAGRDDEDRLRALLERFDVELVPFVHGARAASFMRVVRALCRGRCDLAVMEGTGIAGGVALLVARLARGVPYVVSTGDAVGPFVARARPALGPLFAAYERVLYRASAGVIGWSPYLVGRALSFGAPRAVTAAGWAPHPRKASELSESRQRIRAALGIAPGTIVVGLVGSLAWNRRVGFCYGHELVRAAARVRRRDVTVLVVGDGTGRARLERLAGAELGGRVLVPGAVPRNEVPDYLAAMDVASLPQSVDGVGSFRYTTKLSEYLAAGLPVITGQIPLAYDLDGGWLWRLPGRAPWDEEYVSALATLLDGLDAPTIMARRASVPRRLPEFDRGRQVARVTEFLADVLRDRRGAP